MDDLELITVDYEEDGVLVRKQIDKAIISGGAWPLVLYLYQELDTSTNEYKSPKAMLVKYRKVRGVYRKHSSINITNSKDALNISDVLKEWFGKTK